MVVDRRRQTLLQTELGWAQKLSLTRRRSQTLDLLDVPQLPTEVLDAGIETLKPDARRHMLSPMLRRVQLKFLCSTCVLHRMERQRTRVIRPCTTITVSEQCHALYDEDKWGKRGAE